MAGGIDWFRWHHGSVSDQKFILIAKKSGASVAEVIAVWACLLEAASASDQRGNFGAVDYEAMDCALGMQEGRAQAIHEAMAARGVVTPGGDVSAWEKRQPKRERTDDNSTERSRAFREKQRQAEPCNATQRQETPRGEESRGEENLSVPDGTGAAAPPPTDRDMVFASGVVLLTAAGVTDRNARSFLAGQCKEHGEAAVRAALERCAQEAPIQPIPWLQAALKPKQARAGPPGKSDALMARNVAVLQRFAEQP